MSMKTVSFNPHFIARLENFKGLATDLSSLTVCCETHDFQLNLTVSRYATKISRFLEHLTFVKENLPFFLSIVVQESSVKTKLLIFVIVTLVTTSKNRKIKSHYWILRRNRKLYATIIRFLIANVYQQVKKSSVAYLHIKFMIYTVLLNASADATCTTETMNGRVWPLLTQSPLQFSVVVVFPFRQEQ